MKFRHVAPVVGLAFALLACSQSSGGVTVDSAAGTTDVETTTAPPPQTTTDTGAPTISTAPSDRPLIVPIDVTTAGAEVSPLIRGLSGASAQYMTAVGATMDSWGGNTASTYNYAAGHFFNAGRGSQYRNTDNGQSGDAARDFLSEGAIARTSTRLAVPTLGWVAASDDPDTCSFPTSGGGCDGDGGATCAAPGAIADPKVTSVASSPEQVAAWVQGLVRDGLAPTYLAMDNEPELWGTTHYDLHPSCTTYEEILDKYLTYADALRPVAPDAKFMGPVMCCWYSHWFTAPGPADGKGPSDFLTWFATMVKAHDDQTGQRTLDALDVHYYPQSDVYNDRTDDETAALRLRSTRSLYDPTYTDESWVRSIIQLLPRLRTVVDEVYPDTQLAISEWNFGADDSMNGALAIADVLGIYGREGVDLACYWRFPPENSPGYFAFKMHGNYDGNGAAFVGQSTPAPTPDVDRLGSYATVDPVSGTLKVMLLNKQPSADLSVELHVSGTALGGSATTYTYGPNDLGAIVPGDVALTGDDVALVLPAYSITVLEVPLAG